MKTQAQNQGQLQELKVMIEKDVIESFERMSKASGMSIADLVVTALKRYRSTHTDWDVKSKKTE